MNAKTCPACVVAAFRRNSRALVVLAVVLCVGVATLAAAAKPATHTVTIDAAKFSPAELSVKAGDTVVWVNQDVVSHTATATKATFDSKSIEPGKSWRFTAKRAGEFPYACSFHPMMKGVVRVK